MKYGPEIVKQFSAIIIVMRLTGTYWEEDIGDHTLRH